ncbi:hypothetical protein Taro_050584, partial [Colocasia esculenta]|nr:hypothetical protein [Colocasia esculenta]
MASRGQCGGVPARDDEQRREERAEQQAPTPQGPVLPPPPPVDYGVFMQGLVQAMQTQAHTQAALQAQLEAQSSRRGMGRVREAISSKFVPEHIQDKMEQEFLSLTQGSMTVLEYEARFSELSKYALHIVEDERRKTKKFVMGLKPSLRTRLVAFDHRRLDEALSISYRQEGEMEQYLEEKKASQKRPAATFQRQDKKKTVYQTPQKPVAVSNSQVPSVRSPGVKKKCPHCGKTHGGSECWLVASRCLKCGSSDHKIKECPRLPQGAQRGAPTLYQNLNVLVRNPMSGLTPVRVRHRPPDRDCLICRLLGSDCDSLPVATKKTTGRIWHCSAPVGLSSQLDAPRVASVSRWFLSLVLHLRLERVVSR